jgi:hypothetical protein
LAKDWNHLAEVHEALRETEASYTKELLGFVHDRVPELDRIRKILDDIGARLSGEQPKTSDSQDRGDASHDREGD